MDGPVTKKDHECEAFDIEECFVPGSLIASSDVQSHSPKFASAALIDRIACQSPQWRGSLLKFVLNRRRAGLGPVFSHPIKKPYSERLSWKPS